MTYKAKCALAALLGVALVYSAYFLWAFQTAHTAAAIYVHMAGAAVLVAFITAALSLAMTLHGRLHGQKPGIADERDRANDWRSMRNAYLFMVSFLWAAPFIVLAGAEPATLANLCLGLLVAAEIVRYGSRVGYELRGV